MGRSINLRKEVKMAKWMYNKDGAKLFQDDDKIPSDYVDSPDKVKGEPKPVKKPVKKKAK